LCKPVIKFMDAHKNSLNSIKSWAEDDRPREKLLQKGINSLSDAELIAILIGSGIPNISAVDLAKEILLAAGNNLNELGRFSLSDLQKHKGIGEAKSISIVAALELGRRRKASEVIRRKTLTASQHVYDLLGSLLGDLQHEEFWALYLNSKNAVIRREQIGVGGIAGTVSDVRKIMRIALESHATALIACHNHPSGNLNPSSADQKLTKKLREAGKLMDIPLLDHVIVSTKGYFSFADEGIL
jgi:DNA repair protein RadC